MNNRINVNTGEPASGGLYPLRVFWGRKWGAVIAILACVWWQYPTKAFAQGMASIEAILKVHNAWATAPASIEIVGASTKDGKKTPIKFTATNMEETIVEWEDTKKVATNTVSFKDDGKLLSFDRAPSGYAQLDITSIFLLSQLQQRGVFVGGPVKVGDKETAGYRIHVNTQRKQLHFGISPVLDEFDVYTSEAGALTGITRLFYNEQSYRYTQTYKFLDYRETDKVYLPYRIEIFMKGRLVEVVEVEKYTINVNVSPTLFKIRESK